MTDFTLNLSHHFSATFSINAAASSSSCTPIFYDLSTLKNEEAIATVEHKSLENIVIFKVQRMFFYSSYFHTCSAATHNILASVT